MLPPTQRRNASVRGGDCHRVTRAVHEAVQRRRRSCGANRRGNEGLFKAGDREGRRTHVQHVSRTVPLTVKLRGRTEAPALGAEGAQFLGARGAKPQAPHGPLQRWLGDPNEATPRPKQAPSSAPAVTPMQRTAQMPTASPTTTPTRPNPNGCPSAEPQLPPKLPPATNERKNAGSSIKAAPPTAPRTTERGDAALAENLRVIYRPRR